MVPFDRSHLLISFHSNYVPILYGTISVIRSTSHVNIHLNEGRQKNVVHTTCTLMTQQMLMHVANSRHYIHRISAKNTHQY